jgi:hypothetical protein
MMYVAGRFEKISEDYLGRFGKILVDTYIDPAVGRSEMPDFQHLRTERFAVGSFWIARLIVRREASVHRHNLVQSLADTQESCT